MKLSIIMPVYNEVNTIENIVSVVSATPYNKEIIIVDDFSYDGTRDKYDVIKEKYSSDETEIKVILHKKNGGKGRAIRTAQKHVTGDIVIIQDADLEYDPNEYHVLLNPILKKNADVVYGSRFLGPEHRVLFFWHYLGNTFLTLYSNMLTNLNLTDMETCYKVFKADIFKALKLTSNRFGIEPEITAKIAKMRLRIFEVPISYNGRDYSEGKKIGWKDGVSAIYCITKFNLFG